MGKYQTIIEYSIENETDNIYWRHYKANCWLITNEQLVKKYLCKIIWYCNDNHLILFKFISGHNHFILFHDYWHLYNRHANQNSLCLMNTSGLQFFCLMGDNNQNFYTSYAFSSHIKHEICWHFWYIDFYFDRTLMTGLNLCQLVGITNSFITLYQSQSRFNPGHRLNWAHVWLIYVYL